jgi:hypothetical protein
MWLYTMSTVLIRPIGIKSHNINGSKQDSQNRVKSQNTNGSNQDSQHRVESHNTNAILTLV